MAANIDSGAVNTVSKSQITTFYDSTTSVTFNVLNNVKSLFSNLLEKVGPTDTMIHEIQDIVGRPFPLGEASMTISQPVGTKLIDFEVEQGLFLNPQIERKFDFFLYGDLRPTIQIRTNQQPAQAGQLAITVLPGYKYKQEFYDSIFGSIDDGTVVMRTDITNFPYTLLNLMTHTSAEVETPYYSPYPMFDLSNANGTYGRFIVTVFNALKDLSSNGNLSIQLVALLNNTKLHFPTSKPTFLSSGMPFDMKIELLARHNKLSPGLRKLLKLPIEQKSTLYKTISTNTLIHEINKNEDIEAHSGNYMPVQAPGLQVKRTVKTPSSSMINPSVKSPSDIDNRNFIDNQSGLDLAKGVMRKGSDWIGDKVLKPIFDWFGFCHEMVHSLVVVKQQFLPGVNNYNGMNETHVLGLDQSNGISSVDLLGGTSDSFESICNHLIFYNSITWDVDSQPTTLFTIALDPYTFNILTNNILCPRYSKVANEFCYMYADFEIVLNVVGTGFHDGRLLLEFEPSNEVDGPPTTNLVYKQIVNIEPDKNAYFFEMPFAQNCCFLTRPYTSLLGIHNNNNQNFPYLNGKFQLNSYTELKTLQTAPPSVDINIFFRLKNVKFAVPNSAILFPTRQVPTPSVTAHSGNEVEDEAPRLSDDIPEETTTNSGPLATVNPSLPDSAFDHLIGERVYNVKALMQRYSTFLYWKDVDTVPAGNVLLIDITSTACIDHSGEFSNAAIINSPESMDTLDRWLEDFLSYAGSIEFNIQIPGVDIKDRFVVSLVDPNMFSGSQTFRKYGFYGNAFMFRFNTSNNIIEYNGLEGAFNGKIPFMSNRNLRMPLSDIETKLNYTSNIAPFLIAIHPPNYEEEWSIPVGTRIRRRVGPDFSLGPYIGTRRLTTNVAYLSTP